MGKKAALQEAGATRSDVFSIDPDHLQMNYELQTRHFTQSEKQIRALAESIAKSQSGQLEPVKVRYTDENQLELTWGFGRVAAIKLINEDSELRQMAGLDEGERFLVKAVVSSMTDEEAIVEGIEENHQRTDTSVIDDAHAHQRLRERFEWSDKQIAQRFGYGEAWVKRLKRLLELSAKHQRMVHDGKINVMEGIRLADLPEGEREDAIKNAQKDGDNKGKLDKQKFNENLRNKRNKDGKTTSRGASEVRKAMAEMMEDDDPAAAYFASQMTRYLKGELQLKGLRLTIHKIRDGDIPE